MNRAQADEQVRVLLMLLPTWAVEVANTEARPGKPARFKVVARGGGELSVVCDPDMKYHVWLNEGPGLVPRLRNKTQEPFGLDAYVFFDAPSAVAELRMNITQKYERIHAQMKAVTE